MKLTLLSAVALAITTTASAQIMVKSIPTYDATTNANVVDLLNIGTPWNYGMAVSALANGWGSDVGGVINCDPSTLVTPVIFPTAPFTTASVLFGASAADIMHLTLSHPVDFAGPFNNAVPISGQGVMRLPAVNPGAPVTIKFTPSNGATIRCVGFTVLQQKPAQTVRIEWLQGSGPSLNTIATINTGPVATRDTFFWREATSADGFVGFRISVTKGGSLNPIEFMIDDLAFLQ